MLRKILSFIFLLCLFSSTLYATSTATVFDTDTKLMLHMDGADNGTTFADSSSGAKTVTVNGNTVTKTATKKFGTASVYFDGSGDSLTLSDDADWGFGTGDFTIDFWFNPSSVSGFQTFCGVGYVSGWQLSIYSTTISFYIAGSLVSSYAASITTGNFYHLALTRSGTTLRIFLDGTVVDEVSNSSNISKGGGLAIGDDYTGGAIYNGYVDEFRIVKGTAVWTSNFTPPSAAYTAPSVRRRVHIS